MSKNKKTKILFYGDSPTAATGFATVSRNILNGLQDTGKYEISVLGVNYWGDPHNFQYPIWPIGIGGRGDPYGRQRAAEMMLKDFDYDILFLFQDSFILDFMFKKPRPEHPSPLQVLRASKKFMCVGYYPVDGVPKSSWIKSMNQCDVPITYTGFGRKESILAFPEIADKLKVIPHGANTNDFFPLPKYHNEQFRKGYFGEHANKFIATNLNRNQQRKDIPRTMLAFKEFKKRRPNSVLYLHMATKDVGWDLAEVGKAVGLELGKDFVLPGNFGPNQGFPIEVVNQIYNASDVVVSTTLGEGWGLSTVESMATKTPIIFPRNTSLEEIIGENEERGYLVGSGETPSDWTVIPNDNEVVRPLTNVEEMVEKLIYVHDNREEAAKKAEVAYEWVKNNLVWKEHIVPQWIKLFDEAVEKLNKQKGNTSSTNFVSADEF